MAKELPGSYSEMFPGRFIKADLLKGHKVTLTIKKIEGDDLVGENNKSKLEWLVSFEERSLEWVANKTNSYCMMRMWGNDPHAWVGKRVTLYPTTTKFGRETLDCIRIFGSPDIPEDLPITVPQGRKKAWEAVMHKTGKGAPVEPPKATNKPSRIGLDPRILTGLGLLNESAADKFLIDNANMTPAEMLAALNRLIDEAA